MQCEEKATPRPGLKGGEVDIGSVEEWSNDFSDDEGLDWSGSEGDDLDNSESKCSESETESEVAQIPQTLPIDDGIGDSLIGG